jgi:hypothetical protein
MELFPGHCEFGICSENKRWIGTSEDAANATEFVNEAGKEIAGAIGQAPAGDGPLPRS